MRELDTKIVIQLDRQRLPPTRVQQTRAGVVVAVVIDVRIGRIAVRAEITERAVDEDVEERLQLIRDSHRA